MIYKIFIKSFDFYTIKSFLNLFINLNNHQEFFVKIFFLPSKNSKLSLYKSPHVNKKFKEHYEIKTYKVLIVIKNLKKFYYLYKILQLKPSKLFTKLVIKKHS